MQLVSLIIQKQHQSFASCQCNFFTSCKLLQAKEENKKTAIVLIKLRLEFFRVGRKLKFHHQPLLLYIPLLHCLPTLMCARENLPSFCVILYFDRASRMITFYPEFQSLWKESYNSANAAPRFDTNTTVG